MAKEKAKETGKAKAGAAAKAKTKKAKPRRKASLWFLPLCYVAGIVVYAGLCLFGLLRQNAWAKDGAGPTMEVKLDDFTLESIERIIEDNIFTETEELPDGREAIVAQGGSIGPTNNFVTTDGDPQMLYAREDGNAFAPGIVTFDATYNRPTGEIVLYYETKPGQGYSDNRRVWATGNENGAWQFDLSGKKVYSIRLDPDSVADGVLWDVNYIEIGGQKSARDWFTPMPFGWLLLLALPLLGWAALREGFAALDFAIGGYAANRKAKAEIGNNK